MSLAESITFMEIHENEQKYIKTLMTATYVYGNVDSRVTVTRDIHENGAT